MAVNIIYVGVSLIKLVAYERITPSKETYDITGREILSTYG